MVQAIEKLSNKTEMYLEQKNRICYHNTTLVCDFQTMEHKPQTKYVVTYFTRVQDVIDVFEELFYHNLKIKSGIKNINKLK